MPDMNLTEVIVLLDRSGSMATIKDDMEGGFNQYVKELWDLENCRLTLVQFNVDGVETIHESLPIKQVPALRLEPKGGTPLLDAMGMTIDRTGERFRNTPEDRRPGQVMFVVITDGQENSSHEYTKERVKQMVEHQAEVYKWAFVYLGANVDAFAEAGELSIQAMANYSGRPEDAGSRAALFQHLASGTRKYAERKIMKPTQDWGQKERDEMEGKKPELGAPDSK